ncbi:MAG: hypothetical protein JXB88_22680 [Spirochaetales bacterium]|nr:hypothetical protein [Spirochaetales bacterium]
MKKKTLPYENIITLKKNNQMEHVYDVELTYHNNLLHYSSVECHFVLYPYSRNITSKNITFCPFEEYVKDIQSNQRSAYQEITSQFNKLFGILLGVIIVSIFYFFHPASFLSVESLLSLLGAYFIGKELWDDIENFLISISSSLRIRYQPGYYSYKLVRNSTLAAYSRLAKKNRYGKVMLLPEKIDFIEQSNSQTLRLFFKKDSYKDKSEDILHIISIHIDPEIEEELESKGYMFGVKLTFNRKFLGIMHSDDYFQSFNKNKKGCLNAQGNWCPDSVFFRHSLLFGRIRMYLSCSIFDNTALMKHE